MELFRYATNAYGQEVLLGASWDLLWWFFGAGAAFIILHVIYMAVSGSRRTSLSDRGGGGRV